MEILKERMGGCLRMEHFNCEYGFSKVAPAWMSFTCLDCPWYGLEIIPTRTYFCYLEGDWTAWLYFDGFLCVLVFQWPNISIVCCRWWWWWRRQWQQQQWLQRLWWSVCCAHEFVLNGPLCQSNKGFGVNNVKSGSTNIAQMPSWLQECSCWFPVLEHVGLISTHCFVVSGFQLLSAFVLYYCLIPWKSDGSLTSFMHSLIHFGHIIWDKGNYCQNMSRLDIQMSAGSIKRWYTVKLFILPNQSLKPSIKHFSLLFFILHFR